MPKLKDIKAEGEVKTFPCPWCGAKVYETGTTWACSKCNFYMPKRKKEG